MKFKAFISYSSEDRIVGNRFHTAIERYKIPSALRGRRTRSGLIKKRIGAIFRDRTDLTASDDLGDVILAGLKQSEFLIVLCSPASAQSRWVNQEISSFRAMGRGDNIIALLVSGLPSEFHPEQNPEGAFAPALIREVNSDGKSVKLPEPFAPDLREMGVDGKGGDGFDLSKLKVLARMMDIPLAELTQRQLEVERREKRVITSVAAAMMVLAVAATVGGWLAVRQTREANARLADAIDSAARQVEVASTYQDRFGVPTKVLKDLLDAADKDFAGLIDRAGARSNLVLQRANLSLNLADFSSIVGDDVLREKLIQQAKDDLKEMQGRPRSWLSRLGLEDWPSQRSLDEVQMRLLDFESIEAVSKDNRTVALQKAEDALALATSRSMHTNDYQWAVEQAARICSLAETHYQLADYSASAFYYADCVDEYKQLAESPNSYDKTLISLALINAQSNLAKVVRGLNERERSHELGGEVVNATAALVEQDPQDSHLQRTYLVNLTWLGDAILADKNNARSALIHYDRALKVSERLTNNDNTRIDWRRDRAIVQERRASAFLQTCDGQYQCDIGAARSAIEEAITLIRSLIARDPEQRDWQRDLSVNLEVLAVASMAGVDPETENYSSALDRAIGALKEALSIRTKLLNVAPRDEIALHDLAHISLLLATHEALLDDDSLWQPRFAVAEKQYSVLLDLYRETGNDSWAASKYDLAVLYVKKFQIFNSKGNEEAAQRSLAMAENTLRELNVRYPEEQQYAVAINQIKQWRVEMAESDR
ncbi:MAG: toll/interleukin-1 receptor domain-containing protein [Granulosicoccus sp.]